VVVGNEVLDAMPVRLYARTGGHWHERGVVCAKDGRAGAEAFAFEDRPLENDAIPAVLLGIPGDHDIVTETHAEAEGFTRAVGALLARGAAFFIDYGFPASEYYHPHRTGGTLMCHYRHHAHPDPFLYPGLQDITAHVNFSGIAQAAVEAGLQVSGYASQARFLMNAGITDLMMSLDPSDARASLPQANAVQKLLSEAEMGELFKVIALTRGIDDAMPLDGFARGDRSFALWSPGRHVALDVHHLSLRDRAVSLAAVAAEDRAGTPAGRCPVPLVRPRVRAAVRVDDPAVAGGAGDREAAVGAGPLCLALFLRHSQPPRHRRHPGLVHPVLIWSTLSPQALAIAPASTDAAASRAASRRAACG
jgi:hypothetical protein